MGDNFAIMQTCKNSKYKNAVHNKKTHTHTHTHTHTQKRKPGKGYTDRSFLIDINKHLINIWTGAQPQEESSTCTFCKEVPLFTSPLRKMEKACR